MNVLYLTLVLPLIVCSVNTQDEDKLSPAFFIERGKKVDLNNYPIGETPITFLVNSSDPNFKTIISNITETHVPVVIGADPPLVKFNLTSYFNELNTTNFGKNLVFIDNVASTMDIGHDFGTIHGLVLIANMQTQGRGSNTTKWPSPRGDVYMNINLRLNDPARAGLLPAFCGLSLIKAVKATPNGNYSKLPINFSWPISTVWMPWNKKIGGVLVEKTITNDINNWYTVGCGLRVNSIIEFSVSKMIDEYNCKNPNDKLKQLDLTTLLARAVNYMEEYFPILETKPSEFTKLIKEYWVNNKKRVVVNVNPEIVDIKDDGSIEFTDYQGFTGSLQPIADRFGFEPSQIIN